MSQQAESPGLKVGSRAELPAGWPGRAGQASGTIPVPAAPAWQPSSRGDGDQ